MGEFADMANDGMEDGSAPPADHVPRRGRAPVQTDEERKKKRRAADQAKKAAAEVEAVVSDAHVTTEEAKLERELLEVEASGYSAVDDWRENLSKELMAAKVQQLAAEARKGYVERFQVDCRGKAGWAARKVAEARTNLEEVKEISRAEVSRAEREHEQRKAFFEDKILEWARAQPKDKGTNGSIRIPEAKVRIEVREAQLGGCTILDEKMLLGEIVEKLGVMTASDLGLVELKPQLCVPEARAYVEANPDLDWKYAHVEEKRDGDKLVIVRL